MKEIQEQGKQGNMADSGLNPPPIQLGKQENPTPTSQQDFGLGIQSAKKGNDVLRHSVTASRGKQYVDNQNTAEFTQYASEPIMPVQSGANNSGNVQFPVTGSTRYAHAFNTSNNLNIYNSKIMRYTARPSVYLRGRNVLVPLGGVAFINAAAPNNNPTADVVAVTSISESVEAVMNNLSASIFSNGSFREYQNWARVQDLRNVVITYFNRSIPFTDFPTKDRFLMEMTYTRDCAIAILPLHAYSNIVSYYKFLDDSNMQFRTTPLALLYDSSVQSKFIQIASTVKGLPVLDEVLFDRLSDLGRLHTSSEESGMWSAILMQDVSIANLATLQVVYSNGGYTCRTALPTIGTLGTSTTRPYTLPTSLAGWYDILLSNDTTAILRALDDALALASTIRSNYSILLAAAMQLSVKGAVKYKDVSDYTCGSAKGIAWIPDDRFPTFDYAYKERVEYAPAFANGEDGSTNITYYTMLSDLPGLVNSPNYSTVYTMKRPVGPYHGEEAWGLDEILAIGLFRSPSMSPTMVHALQVDRPGYECAALYGATTVEITHELSGNAGFNYFIDTYFGDIYQPEWVSAFIVSNTTGTVSANAYNNPAIGFYGNTNSYAPRLTSLSPTALLEFGITIGTALTASYTTPYKIFNFNAGALTSSALAIAIPGFMHILNHLDLTNFLIGANRVAGGSDSPLYLDSSYRQTVWDDFDISLMDNVLNVTAKNLALEVVAKSTYKQTMEGGKA